MSLTSTSGIVVNVAPLCDWFSEDIEYRDGAEVIDNILHLYQDQSVKYSNLHDYEIREIYPNHDPSISQTFQANNGEILLNGDALKGDTNGLLVIGFFHKNLTYPVKRTDIQLSEDFDIRMNVEDTQSSLSLRYKRSSNEPKSGSASYPYILQYSIINSKQDKWENTSVMFENPDSFHRHPNLIIDYEVYPNYRNSQGIKFRLLSSKGKTHLLGAVSRFEDIILCDNILQKSIPVDNWIRQSNVYDIPFEIYSFDPSTGKEEWHSYPLMRAAIAEQHLKFDELDIQIIDISANPSIDGQNLMVKITIQTNTNLHDSDIIEELVNQIEFNFISSHQKSIAETHEKLPGDKIKLNLKFHLADYPLSKFNIAMCYNSSPVNRKTKHLTPIVINFIKKINSDTFECAIHPRYLSLKKEVTTVFEVPEGGTMFCPNCSEGVYWQPKCTVSTCGWEDGKPMSQGFVVQNNNWYKDVKQLNAGNFELKLDSLSPGSYRLVFKSNTYSFSI